jgi:hypothetical protein
MKSDWIYTLYLIIGIIGILWGIGISVHAVRSKNKILKPKIKVKCSGGSNIYAGQLGNFVIFVQVANIGDRTINLTSISLELPNKKRIALTDSSHASGSGLPFKLTKENVARYWFDMKDVANMLLKDGYKKTVELKGIAHDAVGREYKSKLYSVVDIEGWAKNK